MSTIPYEYLTSTNALHCKKTIFCYICIIFLKGCALKLGYQHLYRLAVLVGMNCQTLVTTGGMISLYM
jgi:hypothetical protein